MDGGLGNEVAPGDVVEDVHFRGKESEFSLSLRQPESSNLVERSDEAAVHGEGDYLDSSFDVISGILEGRTASGNISAGDGSATRFVGDAGNMVEELMVKKNYDGSNVAIVGMSNHREKLESRWTQWQPRFQVGVGSGSGSSRSNVWHRDDGQTASPCENNNTQNVSSSEFMGQGTSNDLSTEAVGQLVDTEHVESADMVSRGGFRTKMLSKSGFADFFIKNTLKGKGAVFRGHHHNVARHEPVVQENGRTPIVMTTSCSASTSLGENHVIPSVSGVTRPRYGGVDHDGVSLREWLNVGRHGVDKVECFHIFRRIVDLVDSFHSKGVVLSELRPSCFKLLPSKQVRYLGSADKRDDLGNALDQDVPCLGIPTSKKRIIDQGLFSSPGLHMKKQKLSESVNPGNRWPQFSVKYGSSKLKTGEDDFAFRQQVLNDSTGGNSNVGHGAQSNLSFPRLSNVVQQQLLTCAKDPVEEKWYASPEELSEGIHTMSSNIYALGVLLFELLSHFDSEGARATAMSDLCNRILPPHFLSENLKEAGFCLLLLHPEPSSRPTTREILQSDVINGLPDVSVEELSSSIEKDDAESTKEMRLMRNISQLESAYFSMRGKVQVPEANPSARQDKYLLRNREIWQTEEEAERNYNSADCLGEFFDGLCKYARYSKFQVRGSLRTGEFNNSANVICSLSFDRDKDYFAAAGVSKKIKIYDFGSLFNDSVDIHYPAVEMTNKSKLSCICWNNYIKNYLASTDYDGVVKKNSLATIKNIANVCCVQFSSHSTHLLAFGSADFRTYCYDIRHVRMPWCILSGHEKAVSYVKFVDADTIVTASTDNSLKLWDLKKTNGSGLSMDACSSTLRGHTNEKTSFCFQNFVGLSVADGYISCGSETNEVYAYHRSLPMPMASHKFGSEDPISGKETDDDNGQFVSSVCWKGNSDTLLAANSSGCIKVLQMV
ncbi:Protein SPA1-RELATED 2 [Linum perenne]